MQVKAWKGGPSGFGIRIGKDDVRKHFQPEWESVRVFIEEEPFEFPLRATFRTTCPELRGVAIKEYLRANNMLPWPKGSPPTLFLTLISGRDFRLSITRDEVL